MSRVIPIALSAKYAAGTAKLCQCLRLERKDGFVVGLTSADHDVVVPSGTLNDAGEDMGGTYLAWPGITPTEIARAAGLAMDNLEATFGQDDSYVNRPDVLQGMWAATRFHHFECDPDDPGAGVNEQMKGNSGDFDLAQLEYRAELLSLLDRLQQPIGHYTSKTCRVRFGSQGEGMCNVNVAAYTFTGTLTQVDSPRVVHDSARGESAGYFNDALLTFDTGDLAGVPVKVKSFTGGQFTFDLPLFSTPSVGDAYTVLAGCDKTRDTCRDRFSNVVNMQAEPDTPGTDYLTSPP